MNGSSSSMGQAGKSDAQPAGTQRVALVHDWLTGMRGGEKVLELLCERFPDAPLWTLLHVPGTVNATLENRPIHTSLLQHMPQAAKRYRHYLPLFPLFAECNKAHGVDLVISTSHAVAKGMVRRSSGKRPKHICYIHTPMRYAWDLFDAYFGPERVGAFKSRFLFRPIVAMLRRYDRWTCDRVDLFVANSRYVADRVRRVYGREAEVLAPPVDTERFRTLERKAEDTYLVVSALVPYKQVDQAIRACSQLGRKLRIVGKGPELPALQALAKKLGADVDFIGFASDADLDGYLCRARALLFPGVEDFGIVPVEAIACGCPVIALGVGGVLDSMTDRTSVLYDTATTDGLAAAIERFEAVEDGFVEAELRAHAQKFSHRTFTEGLERLLHRFAATPGEAQAHLLHAPLAQV